MKQFYLKLIEVFKKQEIKDLFTSKGLTTIKYIDLYAGQDYDESATDKIHCFPALLVSWSIDYSGETPIATINIRIAYEQFRDTSSIGRNSNVALDFIDFTDLVDCVIKTIETEHTGKLKLYSEGMTVEDTVVDVFSLTYQCAYSKKEDNAIAEYVKGGIDNITIDQNMLKVFLG